MTINKMKIEKKKLAWYKWEKRWQRSPILLFLDRSIGFRLFLALLTAFLLLLVVSQVEKSFQSQNCKLDDSFAGCLEREIKSLVTIGNIDGFSIATVAILYLLESPARKKQEHYQAWQVIDNAAAAKVPTSYARFQALQDLNADGVSLKGIDVPKADLEGISLPGANLSEADLSGAILIEANLVGANLSGANLSEADLSGAILIEANLVGANLSGANLSEADLSGAILLRAILLGADLNRADFSGAILLKTNPLGVDLSGINSLGPIFSEAELGKAILSRAILSRTNNLTLKQVKSAKNSEHAIFSDDFRQELELLPESVGEDKETE
jgi:uncharacterized protein YjbI with pentapeptide repeats